MKEKTKRMTEEMINALKEVVIKEKTQQAFGLMTNTEAMILLNVGFRLKYDADYQFLKNNLGKEVTANFQFEWPGLLLLNSSHKVVDYLLM